MKRAIGVVLQVSLLVGLTTAVIGAAPASAVTLDPNCTANTLAGNDDGSTASIPLAFNLNFFGTTYDHLFVNNNGNVTFDAGNGSFTPSPINSYGSALIAPFWADIDTRLGSPVTYGTTTFDGDPAFCATWPGVGYYNSHTDKLNYFQLLLVDRSAGNAAGDFDIVFNYQNIQWDTSDSAGAARAGYTNGTAATSYELPGSGTPGALVDTNMSTGLVNNTNNGTDGRYLYQVRNGAPPHQLAVTKDGTGTGTVTSSPAGIDCGQTCSASFADSTPVDLTATPDAGSVFTGWSGDCSGTGTCSVTMSADHTVNATFGTQGGGGTSLFLTKSGSPDPVQEQNPVTYTLAVSNSGPDNANDVVVSDTLPAGMTFDQASADQGSCSFASGTVTCNLGTISPTGDGSVNVTIIAQAPNVTADTTITNNASVSSSNADPASASFDSHVLVNNGGSTQGEVPPDTTVPLTYTTSTQSGNGQPAVNAGDNTAVSIVIPPGGPGGSVSLNEVPCAVSPCIGSTAAKDRAATNAAAAGQVVFGGVVFDVVPPDNYPNNKPFRVTMLYDKTLHPTQGPVYYFKQGVTPTEIKLSHCGTTSPNGGKPCVLQNALITTGPPISKGDWRIVVRINSDPRMRK